jgi:hypothetical protein
MYATTMLTEMFGGRVSLVRPIMTFSPPAPPIRWEISMLPGAHTETLPSKTEEDLGNGNDIAWVANNVREPVFIDRGAGDDVINAGNGNSILLGGAGDDLLFAGSGRNLVIGGIGNDVLAASKSGGSILIGGSTNHDANEQALRDILAEWSSNRWRQERSAHVTDGSGSANRINRGAFLNSSTLIDDGVVDIVFGDSQRDWIFERPARPRFRPAVRPWLEILAAMH